MHKNIQEYINLRKRNKNTYHSFTMKIFAFTRRPADYNSKLLIQCVYQCPAVNS